LDQIERMGIAKGISPGQGDENGYVCEGARIVVTTAAASDYGIRITSLWLQGTAFASCLTAQMASCQFGVTQGAIRAAKGWLITTVWQGMVAFSSAT
jgi:hypothetical protein